jgi:hypothetical protein
MKAKTPTRNWNGSVCNPLHSTEVIYHALDTLEIRSYNMQKKEFEKTAYSWLIALVPASKQSDFIDALVRVQTYRLGQLSPEVLRV